MFVAAREALLACVGEGAGDRGVGPALAAGVVDVGAERRAALGVAPRPALLAAHVEEVRVDRDRRLAERLPRLQRREHFGGLPQPLAGARPRITFAAGLNALVAVDQQSRVQPTGGALDGHQVPAVVHLVPATAGVEHRRRMSTAEVVDEVRPAGVRDRARQQRRGRRPGRSACPPSSPAQHTASARRRTPPDAGGSRLASARSPFRRDDPQQDHSNHSQPHSQLSVTVLHHDSGISRCYSCVGIRRPCG